MRNEELHVERVINSVLASVNLANFSLTVLNDGSTDRTAEILDSLHDPRLHVMHGRELPDGWLGKPHACHQLSQSNSATSAEYLVFLDADLTLAPEAISASIATLERRGWDFISPHPRELASSPLARLIQPLMQWSWISSVPVRLGISLKVPSMAIANGQFVIVKRSAYEAIGGHATIRSEVIEDLELARTLVSGKFKGGVAIASDVAECLMYANDREMRAGYRKSLWRAFGSPFGTFMAIALLAITQIAPLIIALAGSRIGWTLFALAAFTHALSAIRTRSNPLNTWAHPVAIALFIVMAIDSLAAKRNGKLIWKDRALL